MEFMQQTQQLSRMINKNKMKKDQLTAFYPFIIYSYTSVMSPDSSRFLLVSFETQTVRFPISSNVRRTFGK